MTDKIEPKGEGLASEDFEVADQILDLLPNDPGRALELYMQAKPAVKNMIGGDNPQDLLIEVDPEIQAENIMGYIGARDGSDEVGMQRFYNQSNQRTKEVIDGLNKEQDEPE